MTRRGASNETTVRAAARAAVLVSLLALGSGWSSADPRLPTGDGSAREVSVVKPPFDDLRIRWSALVHEEGGEFLISRHGIGGPTSVVARVRPRVDGRYNVAHRGAAGSWIYEIRYRDRRGREHNLATIRLNVENLDSARGVLTGGAPVQPLAVLTAAVLSSPAAADSAWSPAGRPSPPDGPGRWPPTPPP
jgi:hypothetical protein